MKYLIVIPDGCADEPQESLGGKTPLQAARTPAMDRVAALGQVGLSNNTPAHLPAGSDVANMCLFGYDPNQFYTGRAPLEAAALHVELGEHDWAVRCNLVTIQDQIMKSFTAGHISSAEAAELLAAGNQHLDASAWRFVAGVSYRNLLIYHGGDRNLFTRETQATPPHDLSDQCILDDFPRGPGSQTLSDIMQQSMNWFADHPVNQRRVAQGKPPATNVWLWGLGQRPQLASFQQRFGLRGEMITAVDLLRGLALLMGWTIREAAGATGYLDTNYASKGQAGIAAFQAGADVVCVHVEAPDEASHEGRVEEKVKALEQIDQHIVAPIMEHLQSQGPHRILVTPDHPTFLRTKTHTHGDVPFALCGSGVAPDEYTQYSEHSAAQSGLRFAEGWKLMEWVVGGGE